MTQQSAIFDRRLRPRTATKAYTGWVLLTSDIGALLFSVVASIGVNAVANHRIDLGLYLALWPFLLVFPLTYAFMGLYSGLAMGAPEELRRSTIASVVLFLAWAAFAVTLHRASYAVLWTLLLAATLTVVVVPLMRACARQSFGRKDWWAVPAVVFGSGETGASVVRALKNEPGLGIKPIAVFDEALASIHSMQGVPVLPLASLDQFLQRHERLSYGIFVMPDIPKHRLAQMIEAHASEFSHVLVIRDLKSDVRLGADSKNVSVMGGLEVRQHTAASNYELARRTIDVLFVLLGAVIAAPIALAVACWVALDSRGPVFYSQYRIGTNGRRFRTWKFRSMVVNADRILAQQLAADPALRDEWERDQKLKNDPRITVSGSFLSRTGLDELPQLWNVLKGDMSLVGPRGSAAKEAQRYGASFGTGKRVDLFSANKRSIWLDVSNLFRSLAVGLIRKRA